MISKLKVEVKTLSPIHISSGKEELFLDYDFIRQGNQILVMDIDKILQGVSEQQLKGKLEPKISNLLTSSQYSRCLAYKLKIDGTTPQRIKEQQKDVYFNPYFPGSSIKGALRTAILWHHFQPPLDLNALHPRAAKISFSRLERHFLGKDPHHDLLRALKVSDFFSPTPVNMEALEIHTYSLSGQPPKLQPNPRLVAWVEAIPEGAKFLGEIWLENYFLEAKELGFHHKADWLRQFPVSCRYFVESIIKEEQRFYSQYGMLKIASFYSQLNHQTKTLGDNQFLLQLAWGAGWQAKTIGTRLSAPEIRQIVRRYGLDRKRNYPVFPKTRRLAQKVNKPLGWLIATLEQA